MYNHTKHEQVACLGIIAAFILFFPNAAMTHGIATEQTKVVENYQVEFGYNSLSNIKAGDYTIFTVRLFDNNTKEQIKFDSVFIKITRDEINIFAGRILADPNKQGGTAEAGTVLSDHGNYQVESTISVGGKLLPVASFNFVVEPTASDLKEEGKFNQDWKAIAFKVALVAIGLALGLALGRKLRKA